MKRFLTLAAVAIAPLDVTAWGVDNDAADALARWDYWPPLPSRPHFARYLSSRPGGIHLKPQSFESVNLFELGDATKLTNKLLYGSVLLRPTLLDADAAESDVGARRAFEFAVQKIKSTGDVSISPDVKLIKAVVLPLSVTGDNGASEMVVVHHHTTTKRDVMEFKSHVELGINFYLTIEDVKFNRRHHVVVGLDREGAHNVFQHTHSPLNHADQPSCAVTDGQCDGLTKRPRILSYNVWNTNPSGDVYGPMRRWDQYVNRLEHLVRFVKEARADIIGFQEVRYDGVFGGRGEHAQIQHLTSRLPGYQYTYQAAMSYLNDRSPFERIEEGPAVFSKYPIIETDYLLLSRDPNDPNDSHQRLCLHAVVSHPTWGNIDIYVTHLSLSERSREKTMVEIWEFMKRGKGVTQVLLGDLNAEPQSRGIQFLQGKSTLDGIKTDLKDAWLEKHTEPEPRSDDPEDKERRFTFPSDAPSKRIDFVLYRGKGSVHECEIIGQAPTEDTKDYPKDVGMLNARSPIYASDHRGVIAEFTE